MLDPRFPIPQELISNIPQGTKLKSAKGEGLKNGKCIRALKTTVLRTQIPKGPK
jgi:hypothetical protein